MHKVNLNPIYKTENNFNSEKQEIQELETYTPIKNNDNIKGRKTKKFPIDIVFRENKK